eukprot:9479855-Prorocentrum_lima.AAC.1
MDQSFIQGVRPLNLRVTPFESHADFQVHGLGEAANFPPCPVTQYTHPTFEVEAAHGQIRCL